MCVRSLEARAKICIGRLLTLRHAGRTADKFKKDRALRVAVRLRFLVSSVACPAPKTRMIVNPGW